MKATNCKRKTYNEVIGKTEDNKIIVLDDIFEYKDNTLKGATGSSFSAISKEEREERINDYDFEELWKDAVENNRTTQGLEEWSEEVRDNYEEDFFFDLSYRELWPKIREAFPEYENEEEYPLFECVGGGRMFPVEMEVVLRPDLVKKINKIEEVNKQ